MPREDDSAPRLRTRGGSSSNTNCSFLFGLVQDMILEVISTGEFYVMLWIIFF